MCPVTEINLKKQDCAKRVGDEDHSNLLLRSGGSQLQVWAECGEQVGFQVTTPGQ
jgi:hypothetical protein